MSTDPTTDLALTDLIYTDSSIRMMCGEPAPAVVNGGGFLGCTLDAGHDGKHRVTIWWGADDGHAPRPEADTSGGEGRG